MPFRAVVHPVRGEPLLQELEHLDLGALVVFDGLAADAGASLECLERFVPLLQVLELLADRVVIEGLEPRVLLVRREQRAHLLDVLAVRSLARAREHPVRLRDCSRRA